jgi:hypothetical protein
MLQVMKNLLCRTWEVVKEVQQGSHLNQSTRNDSKLDRCTRTILVSVTPAVLPRAMASVEVIRLGVIYCSGIVQLALS